MPGRQKWLWTTLILLCAAAAVGLAEERGSAGSLLPHGYCFTWNPALLWTHVASDSLIGAAYVSIPLTLVHLVRRRTDLPFNWIVVLFAIFILSCGATHWIEVWTVWHPDYWLSGNVKAVTAVASVLTAGALVRLVPRILSIPTLSQLTQAKSALEAEVASRRAAEAALLRERAELERRVVQRTEELARAVAQANAAHAAAEQANRLKDRFLAKVSHELRTPLQSTLSWSQILQQPGLEPAGVAQAADRIVHNVRSQARLIDDLLDISRILSGKLALDMKVAEAGEVVLRAVEVVRSAHKHRHITIDVIGCGEGPIALQTDPVRLEQVVLNLVNNAVQASAVGGLVEVQVQVLGPALLLQVRDWGSGIEASDLPHIFEPFRQGFSRGRRDGSHRGLGLGLAITRSIVDLFGGDLQAASAGAGQGATFTLRLPLAAPQAAPGSAPGGALNEDERRCLAGLRVVYVEDEPDIGEGVRLMLSELGVRVDLCPGFDAARTRIAAGAFDVLLSDLNLGHGRTALELMALLHAHGSATPALVLSAYGTIEDRKASLQAGFAMHLVKPIVAADLARALIQAVQGAGARVEGTSAPAG
jgi:signal transduction histidine kinase/ActR/RegA family two-component response regulator